MPAIAQRRAPPCDGENAEAVWWNDVADALKPAGLADEAPRAQPRQTMGLGERPPDHDIGVRTNIGKKRVAAEIEVRLVNHDGDIGRGATRDFANRLAR